jgi:large subunit ribosomal protein L30
MERMSTPMANERTDSKGGTVTVTLMVSPTGFDRKQATTVKGLGLRRIRHSVELKDTPSIRGMIHKVRHLVEVK